jgi:hypothetical protein
LWRRQSEPPIWRLSAAGGLRCEGCWAVKLKVGLTVGWH